MAAPSLVECSFFIPLLRDQHLSDGESHENDAWDWLDNQLFEHFEGGTCAEGNYRGFYKDPDTGQRVDDESQKFIVAIPRTRLPRLRKLLGQACLVFQQKCIYLSVAGRVEFVKRLPS